VTRRAVVGACAAAGLVAGVAIGYAAGGSHRAVTSLAVQRGGTPVAAPTVAALVRTKLFADNLGVEGVHAHVVHGTALVELSYTDDSGDDASRVVQRAATTLQSLVATRFPALGVGVVDPARAGGAERHPIRDGLSGALAGLFVGTFVPLGRRARRGEPAPPPPPPPLPPVPPAPAPVPAAEPEPGPRTGQSPLAALRAEVEARRDEFPPDQVAEWEAYLDAFEAQAQDGEIPAGLRGMLDDVFEPLRRSP
jgi:hypothetical protein